MARAAKHRNCVNRRLAVLIVAASCVFCVSAQQKTAKTTPKAGPAKPGVVSGRIFAITGAGDIKPARLAEVYLLYLYRSVKAAEEDKEEQNSAGMAWLRERHKAAEDYLEALKRDGMKWSDSLTCLKELRSYDKAVAETLKWSEDQKKTSQLLFGNADEEGNFKIAGARPGIYLLLARGRAGFNEAFWLSGHVTVESGKETTVKLASPEIVCLVMQ